MVKRGNEHSQLSREEYEALEARGSGKASDNDKFSMASSDTLGQRRIVKSARKWKTAKAETSSASSGGGSNPFSNFSFSKSTATPAMAPVAPTGKPSFAMPTLPTYTSTSTPSALSFGSTPAAPKTNIDAEGELQKLTDGFKDYIRDSNLRVNWGLPMTRLATTFLALQKQSKKENNQKKEETSSSTSSSKPLFPPVGSHSPAPVPFSFGSTAPAPSPSTNSMGFSFDTKAPAPATPAPASGFSFATNNEATSPAPSAPASGFSFSFGSAPSTTAAITAAAPAAPTTVPTTSETPASGEEEERDEQIVLESADEDWNLKYTIKVKAYHHRSKDAAPTRFATDSLKLQESKKNANNRRMVMRDTTGKVLLNLGITSDMKFDKSVHQGKGGKPPVCRVVFYGLMDEERGAEMFTLVCKHSEVEAFHAKLLEMAS